MTKRKIGSQHKSLEDNNSSNSSSKSGKGAELGAYVDRNGNPNPRFASTTPIDDQSDISDVTRQRLKNENRLFLCIDFYSDLSFFFGSTMYLWLALSESKDVLMGNESTEQNAGAGWFLEDKMVYTNVTLYMTYGFSAALLMFSAGLLRLYTASTSSDCLPYIFMILASSLAMVSSTLVRRSTFWSNACSSISIHWFALQAATLLLWGSTVPSSTSSHAKRSYLRLSGDVLFLLATLGGIILSYLNLFEANDVFAFQHEYLLIATGILWWLSSGVYLVQTSGISLRRRPTDEDDDEDYFADDEESAHKDLRQDDTESTNDDDLEKQVTKANKTSTKTNHRPDAQNCGSDGTDHSEKSNNDEDESVFTAWTAGPGPSDKENITKSSLDNIFGRVQK